jgi:hypothetical protein
VQHLQHLQHLPLQSSHPPPLVKRRRFPLHLRSRKFQAQLLPLLRWRSNQQLPLVKRRRQLLRPLLLKHQSLLLQSPRSAFQRQRKRLQKSVCLLPEKPFLRLR